MARVDISTLPDSSRLFIYNTERQLDEQQLELVAAGLEGFLDEWAAHGSPLTVGYELPYRHFIVIAVDDSRLGPSGCSIDASTQFLRSFSARTGIEILLAPDVCYRAGEGVHCVTRGEFKKLADAGEVDGSTVVFNSMIQTLGEYRKGRWEVPARESWHARAYTLREVAAK